MASPRFSPKGSSVSRGDLLAGSKLRSQPIRLLLGQSYFDIASVDLVGLALYHILCHFRNTNNALQHALCHQPALLLLYVLFGRFAL